MPSDIIFGDYEQTLVDVSSALREPILTAEEQIERKVDSIIRELDELCAMAANSETVDLVDGQRIGIGQINTRVQLILSFLMARHPLTLKLVSRHG